MDTAADPSAKLPRKRLPNGVPNTSFRRSARRLSGIQRTPAVSLHGKPNLMLIPMNVKTRIRRRAELEGTNPRSRSERAIRSRFAQGLRYFMTWTRVEFSFIGRGLFTLDSTH